MPKKSRKNRNPMMQNVETFVLTVSAGKTNKLIGSAFTNWPSRCAVSPVFVRVKCTATESPGLFQVRVFDGSNLPLRSSRTLLVPLGSSRTVTVYWNGLDVVLPLSWQTANTLIDFTNLCVAKSSTSVVTGVVEVCYKWDSNQLPNTCPTLLSDAGTFMGYHSYNNTSGITSAPEERHRSVVSRQSSDEDKISEHDSLVSHFEAIAFEVDDSCLTAGNLTRSRLTCPVASRNGPFPEDVESGLPHN
jgi:hypothetical protein